MAVKLIVAYDEHSVIGDREMLPWYLPEDLRLFKEKTLGHTVIMGRKTWESLGSARKPLLYLPGRVNIIITSNPADLAEKHYPSLPLEAMSQVFFVTMDQAKDLVRKSNGVARLWPDMEQEADFWVIGGASVYQQFMEEGLVEEVHASEVKGKHSGDTFLCLPSTWTEVSRKPCSGFELVIYRQNVDKKPTR